MNKWLIMALLCALTVSTQATAGPVRADCPEVARLASLDYDDVLILSVVKDKQNSVCNFYISIPPSPSSGLPPAGGRDAINAVGVLMNAKASNVENRDGLRAELQRQFAPALLRALSEPLSFQTEPRDDFKEFATWLSSPEAEKGISDCAVDVYLSSAAYDQQGDVFSCGRVSEGVFAVQANFGYLAVLLQLPDR